MIDPVPTDPADYVLPDWLTEAHSALDAKLGTKILHVSAGGAVARMPVEGNTQPFGLLHGGASCVLVETLGSLAAQAHGMGRRMQAFGVDINATHHKAMRSGWVTGVARALSLGNSIASYEVTITDEDGARVCTARITCALRPMRG